MKNKKSKRTVIRDVHAEYHNETGYIRLIAELLSGEEIVMIEYAPLVKPLFADQDLPDDATDYGNYYDEALEEAHRRNMFIEGECR